MVSPRRPPFFSARRIDLSYIEDENGDLSDKAGSPTRIRGGRTFSRCRPTKCLPAEGKIKMDNLIAIKKRKRHLPLWERGERPCTTQPEARMGIPAVQIVVVPPKPPKKARQPLRQAD